MNSRTPRDPALDSAPLHPDDTPARPVAMDDTPAAPASDEGFDTMSLATLDRPTTTDQNRDAVPAPERHLRAVPEGTEARGFALYVGIDELKAAEAGTDLGEIVRALKALLAELAPSADTYAAVALAPA